VDPDGDIKRDMCKSNPSVKTHLILRIIAGGDAINGVIPGRKMIESQPSIYMGTFIPGGGKIEVIAQAARQRQ